MFLTAVLSVLYTTAIAQVGGWDPAASEKAQKTIEAFQKDNQNASSFFESAYGYVVFPTIAKGALGLGGAHGRGVVYEQNRLIGSAKLTQITWGLQWGGQSYSEVVFFKDKRALDSFKDNNFEFSGQASAVAAKHGASADIAYENGVAVYTLTKGGLMCEASLGGQKFKFFPEEELTDEEFLEESE
jgi:lipid-binding SYLF domain-containing protein